MPGKTRYLFTAAMDVDPDKEALFNEIYDSDAWAKAVDAGRWAVEVRPYTRNRRHALHEAID